MEKMVTCESQREKAKIDFNRKKYIYFETVTLNGQAGNRKNFAQALRENNIEVIFDTVISGSCIPYSETDPEYKHCYKEMMNNNLYAQFGHRFFDSLRIQAKYK